MQKELEHRDAVAREVALESIDIFEAFLPDMFRYKFVGQFFVLQNLRVDTDNQHLFIIGAVENTDLSSTGQAAHGSPQEIVLYFFGCRRFERPDIYALRIYTGHYVFD